MPGVAHHVTQRGNNKQRVFQSDEDFRLYLYLIGKYAVRCGVEILGYCLMPNHVHLVAVPEEEESLARALGGTHGEYALAVNASSTRSGHLWQNRFFSCPMDEGHCWRALRYVDLNPVRAGLVGAAWEWRWSSARAHVVDDDDPVLDAGWRDTLGGWDDDAWRQLLRDGDVEFSDTLRRSTHTGAPLGDRGFVEELERRWGRRLRVGSRGRPRKGSEERQESLRFTV
jgi:putative transposase